MSWLSDARDFLKFAKELRDFLMVIGRCLRDEKEERAQELMEIRVREAIAGRARLQASRMAGPRHNHGRIVEP